MYMRGGPEYAARIKCAGRGGPTRDVRALCGAGLNGAGRPTSPPLDFVQLQLLQRSDIFTFIYI